MVKYVLEVDGKKIEEFDRLPGSLNLPGQRVFGPKSMIESKLRAVEESIPVFDNKTEELVVVEDKLNSENGKWKITYDKQPLPGLVVRADKFILNDYEDQLYNLESSTGIVLNQLNLHSFLLYKLGLMSPPVHMIDKNKNSVSLSKSELADFEAEIRNKIADIKTQRKNRRDKLDSEKDVGAAKVLKGEV